MRAPRFYEEAGLAPGSLSGRLRALLVVRSESGAGSPAGQLAVPGCGCQVSPSAGRSSWHGAVVVLQIAKKNNVTLLALVQLLSVMADETGVC